MADEPEMVPLAPLTIHKAMAQAGLSYSVSQPTRGQIIDAVMRARTIDELRPILIEIIKAIP